MDGLPEAASGRTAIIYEYHTGSIAYFAMDAPDYQEAWELTCTDLASAQRILDEWGCPQLFICLIQPWTAPEA